MYGIYTTTIGGEPIFETKNLIVDSHLEIIRNALFVGVKDYRIRHFYVEFENNVATPPVATPVFDATRNVSYYLNLSGQKDFLRVPVGTTNDNGGSGDLVILGKINQSVGVLGLSFSEAQGSIVYGYGLVASPSIQDHTQDVLFSCVYLPEANQIEVVDGKQLGVQYTVEL